MISVAVLNDLDREPQVAYGEYGEIRAEARRRNGGCTTPSDVRLMEGVLARRGIDWRRKITGKPVLGGLRSVTALDGAIMIIADQRDLDPPQPAWLVQWNAESERTRRAHEDRRDAAARHAREKSRRALAVLAAALIDAEVRINPNSTATRAGHPVHLGHIVPRADARSVRRRHPAGIPLCEHPDRWKPRQLSEADGGPATCQQCLKYAMTVRPVCGWPASPGADWALCGKAAQHFYQDDSGTEHPVCGIHARKAGARVAIEEKVSAVLKALDGSSEDTLTGGQQ
ncbi:MAG: hypothetical protein FWE35_26970 [Streptosporangiales bacterium]|nr:hypothetical protein [Streptosporangiales bacterium]